MKAFKMMSSRGLWAVLLAAGLALLHSGCMTASGSQASQVALGEDEVSMIEAEGEGNRYWPRWRGPSGQGLVKGEGYADRWSDSDNVRWKVAVPGRGNSSPIIWGDRIFLTTAYEGGTRRSVLSFSRSDGSLLWESFAPEAPPERAYAKNGYASSTVATDGTYVYAYLGNQGLIAVDFEGKIAWHNRIADVRSAFHGTAGSPLLYKDKLILFQDLSSVDKAFVAAFDKSSGKEIWRTPRPGKVGWGTPVAIRAGDRDELIVSSNRTVFSYDPESGKELWRCQGNKFEVIPTPVVGHGMIFCSSGRAGPTMAIQPGGSGDVTGTHLQWKAVKGSPFVPSPVLYGDYLYMVNDMISVATCYEAKTGKVMWQGRLGEPARESFSASPVAVDGKVFFTNDEGKTFVLKAGPEFNLLHVNDLKERVLASPALVDGTWYWRTKGHLLAIGK